MQKHILSIIGLASLLALSTQGGQEKLAASIQDARTETMRTSEQLKATLNSLNALTKQSKGSLRPAYDTFCVEVAKTQAAADYTRSRCQWMAGDGRNYFKDWERTINGIANESLRKKALKRMTSVQKSFDNVETALKKANEKFTPFLSDLSDIQKALSTDVTAGGVKAVRSTVRTANWDHQFVNDAVNSAIKELGKMQKALSSEVS